ncbi:hypothetical protein GH714_029085 [Hevea brasiliensis]|uniref:peptidylprolyl isomerase n=1 Tax=Hevea brasiliensis TaxID=3981 RepID=A0A6A6M4P3_HEVBR|nr:hypothetical protein GH714_029085 [Hevea brasiliensis]
MESSKSKTQVIKPLFLKAGIPLALSVAGFIYAKIISRRNIISDNSSSLETKVGKGSLETIDSHEVFLNNSVKNDEEHMIISSQVLSSIESSDFTHNESSFEGELLGLRSRIEELQKRVLALETQFLQYHAMKEEESLLMEIKNKLVLEAAHVEFLDKEISSMEAERERFENLVVEYLRVLEQLEFAKLENGLLRRKVRRISRKMKEQSRVVTEKNLKIEAAEAEILRCYDALETRSSVIKKMEDEVRELQTIVNQLQEEKNELLIKLNPEENSASSASKIDAEVVTMEDYNQLVHELEQLRKDRATEIAELTYLRWTNACLRHELMRIHEQEQEIEQKKEHLDAGVASSSPDQGGSKRKKLLHKLKKWVERSDHMKSKLEEKEKQEIKCLGRLSVSEEAEEDHIIHARRYYDLKVGGGVKAVKGSRVAVHYVAKWKGITFMTSRQGLGVGGGTPYGFDVGQSERGTVLKGLDLGVEGMRVGGQRLLIVPPELAYGNKGVQEIPPNATIELDVELLAIKQSPFGHYCYPQKTCPNCGSVEVPYPLSTNPNCGDPNYHLRCDPQSQKLYFDALNGSSYLVIRIMASFQRMVVQPSPWVSGTCVTQDMLVSEGLWLNQTLPFNVTSSNTIFLFNCSPRLLVSPLNCTPSSLCHRYLENSDKNRSLQCASSLHPCCTFIEGGMPSAYKIRLHSSGCKAFRSILNLDPERPANHWEEGLEIQWASPPEPICETQLDCSGASKCLPAGTNSLFRCLCNSGYQWDHGQGSCQKKKSNRKASLSLKVSIGVISFVSIAAVMGVIILRKSTHVTQAKLTKAREDILKSSNGGKTVRMFQLKEVKRATKNFSKDRVLGSGGFGEVYKAELQDGTVVAIKSAKVDLAFACLRKQKADRPRMKDVVQQLECIIQIVEQEEVLNEVSNDGT